MLIEDAQRLALHSLHHASKPKLVNPTLPEQTRYRITATPQGVERFVDPRYSFGRERIRARFDDYNPGVSIGEPRAPAVTRSPKLRQGSQRPAAIDLDLRGDA